VGEHTASLLADNFSELESLRNAGYDDLVRIPEVGPEVAKSIILFFGQGGTKDLLEKLERAGVWYEKKEAAAEARLEGQTFVFTGRISMAREEAKSLVEQLGGNVALSVSNRTDYVVAGEEAGSKLEKAEKLGVRIIDEAKFCEIIREG
jgi:DNA ligase (NAD+)